MRTSLLIGFIFALCFRSYGQACNLSVSISASAQAICSGSAVVLTANASSGTSPYRYTWNTGETTQTISVNKAGTYTVTVSDNTPTCKATQSITLTTSTTPATPTVTDVSTCINTSATLTATSPGGFYQWYDAALGGNLVGTGSTYTTPVLTSSRTYYVETTINQCTSLRKAATVNIINPINVGDATTCQGTSVTLTASGATSYQWYDTASGGNLISNTASYTTPVLNTTTVYYVVGTANGCVSNRAAATVHVNTAPQAPVVADASICSGSSVTLSATAPSGVVFNWYDVPAGGSPLITSPDFTTPVLTASKTYYVQDSGNGCFSSRVAVTVTVNSIPPVPTGNGATVCPNNTAILTVTADGNTHQWFRSAGSQTILATGDSFQTPVLTKSTSYYVRNVNGGCVSQRKAVAVTVNPVLPPPSVSGQIICSGSTATLTAKAQQGAIEWYDSGTGGNLLSANSSYTTPVLIADAIYYVQAVQSGCSSSRVAVQISVLALPTAPTASGQTICAGSSTTLIASGQGNNFEWYDAVTGGNLLSANPVYSTPALTSSTTYYVQTTNTSGCTSLRTAVTVTVIPYPASPIATGVTICKGTSATLTASTANGTLSWFDAPNGGTQLATGSNFTTPVLTATTTYYVQSTVGQCSSTRTAVTATINPIPDPQFAYSSGTYCSSGSNPTPVVNSPSGGTFSATPAGLVFISTTTGQIDLSVSTLGEYVISFTSNGACPFTNTAKVIITSVPLAQFIYNGPYCQKAANPSPTFNPGASAGTFSATPSGLVFTDVHSGQIDLGQSKAGTYMVTNSIPAFGGCPPSIFTSPVTIEQAPVVSAGPDQSVGIGSVVQLAGSFSGASGVTWSGGSGSFSNASSTTSTYTPATGETTVVLTLTTSDPPGVCGSQSVVTITIGGAVAAPTAASTSTCPGNSATLFAIAPGGNYEWYDAATGGNFLISGAVLTTPALTVTTPYYVQTTVNGVTSSRTKVTVTVNNIAAPTAAGGSGCRGSSTTISASGSTGTYQWYDAATGGNLLSANPTFTTPFLITDTAYYVQTTLNGCVSTRTRVPVIVNPVPVITSADALDVCSGSAFGYNITANTSSTFTWSRAVVANISNAAVNNQTSTTINETLINTSTQSVDVIYLITPLANGCSGDPFNLTVTVYPSLAVTSAKAQTICNNASSNYAIQFNLAPNAYTWSRAAVSGISNSAVSNQSSATIREVLNNNTNKPVNVTYVFSINTTACPAVVFNYVVTINPTASITSPNSITLCSGVALNYTITSNVDSVTYQWSRPSIPVISNPTVSNQTSNTITEALVNTSANTVRVEYLITPYYKGCGGVSFTYVVFVKAQPATPVINTNSPVCLNSDIRLSTTTVAGVTYSWSGPNGFTSSQQNPTINNVTKANAGVYTLTETGNGCTGLVASTNVAVDDPPVANAGANQTVCTNVTTVNLNGDIHGGTTTGVWSSAGTGSFSPSADQLNAQYIPSVADKTSGSVVLTLASTSKDDCTIATSNITITFQPAPIANAGGSRDVCSQDVSVQLNGSAQNNFGVLWTTSGTGSFNPSANVLTPSYIPSVADIKKGAVILSLQATGTLCNSTTDEATIRFIAPPTVNVGLDRYLLKGQNSTLNTVVSDNNVHYLWTPNTNISNDTSKSPVITAIQDVTYTLKVTDARGCVSQDDVVIKVLDPIIAPNTFTPNGDGNNDLWNIPALNKYPGATVDIYTRNGKSVFHSDGYGIAWDGNFDGKPLPVGAYYYIINTKFQDIKVSGYVTIIR